MRSTIVSGALLAFATALSSACGGGGELKSSAQSEPGPAQVSAPAPSAVSETLLASATASAASEALAAPAAVVPAPPAAPQPPSFRERVRNEMSDALGQPVQSRQDALNATYHQIGWRPGTAPTEKQNRLAYHQAMRWGVTLGRLARGGREEPFTPADIAAGPLRKEDLTVLDSAPRGVQLASSKPSSKSARQVDEGREREPEETPAMAAARAATLAQLTARVNKLRETARALDREVTSLEQVAKRPTEGRAALRSESERLEVMARHAESSATSLEQEVRSAESTP